MTYVEFMQVQYIDLSQIVQYVKAPYLEKSIPFVISLLFECHGVPWKEVKPRFRDLEKLSLSPE